MSEIEFACPGCARRFAVPASQAGRYGGCSHCGARFPIPNVSLPTPDAAPPTSASMPVAPPPFVVVEPTPAAQQAPAASGSGSWSWLWLVVLAVSVIGRFGSKCDSQPRPQPKVETKVPRPGNWARPHMSQRVSFSRGDLSVGGTLVTPIDHPGRAHSVVLWFGGSDPQRDSATSEPVLELARQGFAVVVPDHWWCTQDHMLLWCDELAKMPLLEGSRLHAVGIRQASASIWSFVQNPKCPLRSAALMPAPQLTTTDASPAGTPIPVLLFVPPNTGDANTKATVGRAEVEISAVRLDHPDTLKLSAEAGRFFREQASPR